VGVARGGWLIEGYRALMSYIWMLVQLPLDRLDLFILRRTIITLIITLTVSSVSFGQNFKKDLERGLYSTSPDWIFVLQLVSDSLKGFKLVESRHHYDKVSQVLFDSIPPRQIFKPRKSNRDRGKIGGILKVKDGHFTVVYKIDSGFNTYNFVRRDIGYEMYFADYKVERKKLLNRFLTTPQIILHFLNLH
jgi:hypothetical protein